MPTLGKVGIVDKGNYSASATYNSGDFVTYNGSTFLAIKDGVKGIAPSDDKTNWKYLAKGFNEPAASGITVTDTHGIIDGSKGKKTFAQNLFDGIGNWIITKAVTNDTFVNKLTERLINNGTATLEGFALDARQGNPTVEGSLAKQISKLNEDFSSLFKFKEIPTNVIVRDKEIEINYHSLDAIPAFFIIQGYGITEPQYFSLVGNSAYNVKIISFSNANLHTNASQESYRDKTILKADQIIANTSFKIRMIVIKTI